MKQTSTQTKTQPQQLTQQNSQGQTQQRRIKNFVEYWKAAEGNEQREANSFWVELAEIIGVSSPTRALDFERRVRGRRVDIMCEDMGILIENKSRGVNLDAQYQRGRGEGGSKRMVTPYEQAKWYVDNLPRSIEMRWLIVCNFDEIRIHDLNNENPGSTYTQITLDELPAQLHLLNIFTDKKNSRLIKEQELSVDAGKIVGRLYSEFAKQYKNLDTSKEEQRSINVLIVRLVFLLYAEDAGILGGKQKFCNYMQRFDAIDMRQALIKLFEVLNTPDGRTPGIKNERDPYLNEDLAAFPYINGGLFEDEEIIIPQFTEQMRTDLLLEAGIKFNWKDISPTIFGAVFESTLNHETRRSGGMHYTSVENIHKVIDPLFLDDLKRELAAAESIYNEEKRKMALRNFSMKLGELTFFDPAAGSHNFLTETYISLRKLELRALEGFLGAGAGQASMADVTGAFVNEPIQVTIDQFYALEINDFAVAVGKTALWIAEQQMMQQTQELLPNQSFDFLPLKSITNSHVGNALATNWQDVLPAKECNYIIGNPPFVGARNQTKEQKKDLLAVFEGVKNAGNIDYCGAWYMKAAKYTQSAHTRCAFVSTNSICQGEQVANLWKPIHDLGVHIDFAHTTFRWNSEAKDKAQVYCVIVGFSREKTEKHLFMHETNNLTEKIVKPMNINSYLVDAPDLFIFNTSTPICNATNCRSGNKPIDDGNYLFTESEMLSLIEKEPKSKKYFRPWIGAKEFINGYTRYCLWLGDCSPIELKSMPHCLEVVKEVRDFRLGSKSAGTRKLADKPTRFHVETIPKSNYLVLPLTSTSRRKYIPIGFIDELTLASNLLIVVPNATLYDFGVIQSEVFMCWMRRVCGRLGDAYRITKDNVYNNFIWPGVTKDTLGVPVEECVSVKVRENIEACASAVLDARALYTAQAKEAGEKVSLADMYDPDNDFLFPKLTTAHKNLDSAVEAAYGIDFQGNEEKIVAHLFGLYAAVTE